MSEELRRLLAMLSGSGQQDSDATIANVLRQFTGGAGNLAGAEPPPEQTAEQQFDEQPVVIEPFTNPTQTPQPQQEQLSPEQPAQDKQTQEPPLPKSILDAAKTMFGEAQQFDLKKILEDIANRPQEQPPAEQVQQLEQPTQGVNTLQEAMRGAAQPQNQYVMNGTERDFAGQLIALKTLWGNAGNKELQKNLNMTADQIREYASKTAEELRQMGGNVGLNLNGYGSDVRLPDAYRNLQSNDARARLEALTQGQYAMSSDQYFDLKYWDLIHQGYSPRQAKKFAGDMARHYQADRVTYLRGMYNGYGRDGDYTNDFGVDLIGEMSKENPTLAEFYGSVYPTGRERREKLEDSILEQNNALQQLGFARDTGLMNINAQITGNRTLEADKARYRQAEELLKHQLSLDEMKALEEIARNRPDEFQQFAKSAYRLATDILGLSDEDARAFAANATLQKFSNNLGGGRGGGGGGGNRRGGGSDNGGSSEKPVDAKKEIDSLKATINVQNKQIKELEAKLNGNGDWATATFTDDERKAMQEQLNKLIQSRDDLTLRMEALNRRNDPQFGIYDDDSDEDIIEKLKEFKGMYNLSWHELRDKISRYCVDSRMTDDRFHHVMDLVGTLREDTGRRGYYGRGTPKHELYGIKRE